jgi:5-methylcytosine-specific restriction enzyme A
VRARHLVANPNCAACGGTANVEVHHIQPFHLFPDLELVDSNLITLCEKPGYECHFVFGHYHDWYKYNPDVITTAAAYLQAQESAP